MIALLMLKRLYGLSGLDIEFNLSMAIIAIVIIAEVPDNPPKNPYI